MVSTGAVVAGVGIAAGIGVGIAILASGAGGIPGGGYRNVHDLTGKTIKSVDVWYNEPVKVTGIRARGKLKLPGGTSEQLFKSGNTYIHLDFGCYQGKSKDEITNKTGFNVNTPRGYIAFDIVSNFATPDLIVNEKQRQVDVIGVYCYAEANATREIIPIEDLVMEVVKSKQVGSNVEPVLEGTTGIVREEFPFGNGLCTIAFDQIKTLPKDQPLEVSLVTDMKGKDSGTLYQSGFLMLRLLDENNLPVHTFNKSGVKMGGLQSFTMPDTMSVKSVNISLTSEGAGGITTSLSPTELIKISGKLITNSQEVV